MKNSFRCHALRFLYVCLTVALLISANAANAAIAPEGDPVASRAKGHPDLFVRSLHLPLDSLPEDLARTLRGDLDALGIAADLGAYDLRAGRWGSLIAKASLVPGPGVGNTLTWAALGLAAPSSDSAYKDAVWRAFQGYLQANQAVLGVSTAELAAPSIGTYEKNRLVHVYASRVYGGVPVRDSFVKATLNSGNLVLYGTRNWGTINISTTPSVSAEIARGVVGGHLSGFNVAEWSAPELLIVPLASGSKPEAAVGSGYTYRLVWAVGAKVEGSEGSWEALVDAKTGELLAFYDRNSYIDQKKVIGGIFPASNDGNSTNGVPDGIEQPGYPMSRAYVFQGATRLTANSEGLVNVTGNYQTSLTGPFIRIQDQCGAINETATMSCDVLDLSSGPGTDCARPDGHSVGDTHSARTGFYELNRVIDQAKSWMGPGAAANLPVAGWMNRQFPAIMNIDNACNAFFSPIDPISVPPTGSINFYRSGILGANSCRNTGEIPAVFDHEWGHGLDTFDDSPGVSLPGEAYADMTGILRLNASCFGRGFFVSNAASPVGNCPGNGDICTECTGVREVDWMKRQSRMPHDLAWVLDQNPTVPGNCGAVIVPATPFNSGPCQRSTHCEGTIIGESFWDLLKRDLPCHTKGWEAPFPGSNGPVAGGRCKTVGGNANPTIGENSALVLVTRLFYLAAGGVVLGYQCDQTPNAGAPRNGGCNADSWYMSVLAADDDDGNLANGTPHMLAIEAAFRRHGIACRAPAPMNLGCIGTPAPTAKPVVTATAGIRSATINWTAVPNATEYWVLRTDGVHGCNFGKTRVGRVPANALSLTFTQTDLLDGFTYYYSVVPVGGAPVPPTPLPVAPAEACAGPMSDCASVTPLAPSLMSTDCPAPPNQPPTAVDDVASAPRNHSRRINVLVNDTDPNFDVLVVTSVTAPTNGGTAVIDPDSRVRYTPPAGAAIGLVDGFDYVISDGRGGSDTGHVTVTVGGDPCTDPGGFTVLTDAANDSSTGQAEHDALSAAIAQSADGKFTFILKMRGLANPTPDTTWPITYAGGDGAFRFVKMSTQPDPATPTSCTTMAPCFRHGNGSASGAGMPADLLSNYNVDGTIRIVVPGSAIGNPLPGQEFSSFLTRIAIEVPNVATITPDNMGGGPSSILPTGSYEVVSCTQP